MRLTPRARAARPATPRSPPPDPRWGWGAPWPAEGAKTSGVVAEDRIVVRAESNPCHPGSLLARRFARLRTGMTVGAFVAAIEEAGGGRREALATLHFFAKQKHICFAAE